MHDTLEAAGEQRRTSGAVEKRERSTKQIKNKVCEVELCVALHRRPHCRPAECHCRTRWASCTRRTRGSVGGGEPHDANKVAAWEHRSIGAKWLAVICCVVWVNAQGWRASPPPSPPLRASCLSDGRVPQTECLWTRGRVKCRRPWGPSAPLLEEGSLIEALRGQTNHHRSCSSFEEMDPWQWSAPGRKTPHFSHHCAALGKKGIA